MKFKRHHVGLFALAIVAVVAFYLYHESKKRNDKPSGGSNKHPLNQKHGPIKCWLTPTCPWCKKQVKEFQDAGVEYHPQDGSPPEGNGVPQCQSSTTGKSCTGFKKIEDLWSCLE